jgi:3-oxoacyl-ACP reductase-like protein
VVVARLLAQSAAVVAAADTNNLQRKEYFYSLTQSQSEQVVRVE